VKHRTAIATNSSGHSDQNGARFAGQMKESWFESGGRGRNLSEELEV
jgi:hypothetical protein